MLDVSTLDQKSIKQILTRLEADGKVTAGLPGSGLLHLEKELPFLVVYRRRKKDPGTERMIISEASYLLYGKEDKKGYQELITALANTLSDEFKSYMLFEVYTGNPGSNSFVIKGPADKLPTSFEVLKEEILKINNHFSGIYLQAEIKDTPNREPEGMDPLMDVSMAKQSGAVIVGMEIPPVFRNDEGGLYPVFFRGFKNFIIRAIHKFIYDYIRVQTTYEIASYSALGPKFLKKKVFEIDKRLSQIENSYQFLWLVSPANIQEIKKSFFDSNFEKVREYHYRLLPIDPDILKRELYNLRMEEVDDPAMSHLFREKREELDQQITMLAERGSRNFFYNSIRLYKGVDAILCNEAKGLLEEVPEVENPVAEELIDAKGFSSLARKEFEYFRQQDDQFSCRVHIREDVNIMMVSQGELYIPADYKMNKQESTALIQHEVGTHVLTYHNGSRQPLQQLSVGLSDYDPLQEGLAVMSEYLVDGLTPNRLRTLAGRVIAGSALLDGGDFIEIFRLLHRDYGFSGNRAFNITSRIMQGGGFLKDVIYLRGLVDLRKYLREGGDYEPLLAGKFGIKHTRIIRELTERNILNSGCLKPSYLLTENVPDKIRLIREGLPLSKMVSK